MKIEKSYLFYLYIYAATLISIKIIKFSAFKEEGTGWIENSRKRKGTRALGLKGKRLKKTWQNEEFSFAHKVPQQARFVKARPLGPFPLVYMSSAVVKTIALVENTYIASVTENNKISIPMRCRIGIVNLIIST